MEILVIDISHWLKFAIENGDRDGEGKVYGNFGAAYQSLGKY